MFERFTDRARRTMALALMEAKRLNHEYIGTEHILLGLVKEGSGVGANVLKNLSIDLPTVRFEVERLIKAGPSNLVSMGKLPQTPRAKKVIEEAINAARELNHNSVGTEHILLGLIREREGVAAQVLMSLGLSLDAVKSATIRLLKAADTSTGNDESSIGETTQNAAKPPSPAVPETAPGASAVELLDLDGRVSRLESHAGRRTDSMLIRLLLCWTVALTLIVLAVLFFVITRTH